MGRLHAWGIPEQDREDFLSEVIARGLRSVDRFRVDAELSTYLFAIARNLARDRGRQASRRPLVMQLDTDVEAQPDDGPEDDAQRAALQAALEGLPGPDAIYLTLHYVAGWPQRQIAEHFAVSEGSVNQRLSRARKKLRKAVR